MPAAASGIQIEQNNHTTRSRRTLVCVVAALDCEFRKNGFVRFAHVPEFVLENIELERGKHNTPM